MRAFGRVSLGTFAVVVALAACSSSARACDGCGNGGAGLAGRQALQFSVGDCFALGAFQGQMFSYQRFLSDRRALRVAVGLSLDYNDEDIDVEHDDGAQTDSAGLKEWFHNGTGKVQLLFYRGGGPVRFFWGGGPKVTYTDYHYESIDYSSSGGGLDYTFFRTDGRRWAAGLQGLAGLEWFFSDWFSLHAEYAVSAMFESTHRVEERFRSDSSGYDMRTVTDVSSPEFSSDGVRFGLSACF